MQAHPAGYQSQIVGHAIASPLAQVILHTRFGSHRTIDMLVGEQLPRIC
jgi:hydrogenase expression/formation protein HypE